MKRWLGYLCAMAAVVGLSANGSVGKDIGKLQPVQVVYLSCNGSEVLLQTDTGDWGQGNGVSNALQDMKASSSAEVFLEMADYLLLSPDCEDLLPEMMDLLRPSCALCLTDGQPDMGQVGAYLQSHSPRITMNQYRAGQRQLQMLVTQEGRMALVS